MCVRIRNNSTKEYISDDTVIAQHVWLNFSRIDYELYRTDAVRC